MISEITSMLVIIWHIFLIGTSSRKLIAKHDARKRFLSPVSFSQHSATKIGVGKLQAMGYLWPLDTYSLYVCLLFSHLGSSACLCAAEKKYSCFLTAALFLSPPIILLLVEISLKLPLCFCLQSQAPDGDK